MFQFTKHIILKPSVRFLMEDKRLSDENPERPEDKSDGTVPEFSEEYKRDMYWNKGIVED